jgi:hypothetical protein
VDHRQRHLQVRFLVNDMDQKMLALHQCVVDSFQFLHLLDAAHRDVLQNLGEQNLDVDQPFRDVVHRFLVAVVVGVELRYQLKTDCYQDVVGVELRHQLKMDCFQDVVHSVLQVRQAPLVSLHLLRLSLLPAQWRQHREML